VLQTEGRVTIDDVAVVAEELLGRGGVTRYDLSHQLDDLRRRRAITSAEVERFTEKLTAMGVLAV
jgi:hypothetical protein